MKLVKLNLPDVLYVCHRLRAADRREVFALRFDDDPNLLAMEIVRSWGPLAWTAHHEHTPAAVFGATEMWPNVWSCWMMATDEYPKIALGMTKFVRRRIIPHLMESGATRCEARSIDGHTQAHRWIEGLGAVQEARLRRYGRNGEDFLVFRLDSHVQPN